ncbi:MAG TPA: YihY/virulence factor BrkB family protein [Solirubrobacteraceae bacterium]
MTERAPDGSRRVGRASRPTRRGGLSPALFVRAFKRYREHEMTDRAAALTYFAMMALFPTLLVGVTLLGLFGEQGLVQDATNYLLEHGADADTARVVRNALQNVINASGGALGITLVVSLALALNGASGAFGAAGRALNVVYEVKDDRGFVRRKLTDLAATLVVIVLFAVVLAAIFLGGQIARDLFGKIGLGDTAASIWSYVRWPVALIAAMLAYGLVYRVAPDIRPPPVRWITPGAVVGVVLWILLSAGFAVYVRNFATYGAAYGAFGAAIVLLLWLYLSANAFLFGAELNAELQRAARGGQAEDSSRSVSSGG